MRFYHHFQGQERRQVRMLSITDFPLLKKKIADLCSSSQKPGKVFGNIELRELLQRPGRCFKIPFPHQHVCNEEKILFSFILTLLSTLFLFKFLPSILFERGILFFFSSTFSPVGVSNKNQVRHVWFLRRRGSSLNQIDPDKKYQKDFHIFFRSTMEKKN